MTHRLTVEVPEEVYEPLRRLADETGRPLDQLAVDWMRARAEELRASRADQQADEAWQALLGFAGAASLGRPTGADNDGIDADLADEAGGQAG